MNGGDPLPEGPYKGLARFDDSELDERFFFGRDRETEIVASNLIASTSQRPLRAERRRRPLTAAGRGRPAAACARACRVERGRAENGALPVVVDQWRDDPLAAIAAAVGISEPRAPSARMVYLARSSIPRVNSPFGSPLLATPMSPVAMPTTSPLSPINASAAGKPG